jgi:hypothetical protein
MLLFGCINKRSKKEHKTTVQVCDDLYVEVYTVFGSGAYGGDLLSDYLTDSTNFRIYIGTYDDYKARYSYKCEGKSILVEKTAGETKGNVLSEKRKLDLDKLKKEHLFE